MYLFEMCICYVSIYLCSRNRRMSEHGLNTSDISPVGQKISRESMSERMWMHVFDDAGFGSIVFDDALDTSWCKTETVSFLSENISMFFQ